MIKYDPGYWGIRLIWHKTGSVFPKAAALAIPNGILTLIVHIIYHRAMEPDDDNPPMEGVLTMWSGYTFVLGFLIVFRTNQAYSRFWEGASLIHQIRGEWFNATSNLIAFCNVDPAKRAEVEVFQNLLVRLMSMLYCSALQQVCDLKNDTLDIIDSRGIDKVSLDFLGHVNDRCEVLLQWLQRLTLDADDKKVLKIAPPILSRVFQEYSRGIVNLNNVRKIKEIPFPFPFAQMIAAMLMIYWVLCPFLAGTSVKNPFLAFFISVSVNWAYWCLMYISMEIDQPFGEDYNDLPLDALQTDFNLSLYTLLQPLAQCPPAYEMVRGAEREGNGFSRSDTALASTLRKLDSQHSSVTEHHDGMTGEQYLSALEEFSRQHISHVSRCSGTGELKLWNPRGDCERPRKDENAMMTLPAAEPKHQQAPPVFDKPIIYMSGVDPHIHEQAQLRLEIDRLREVLRNERSYPSKSLAEHALPQTASADQKTTSADPNPYSHRQKQVQFGVSRIPPSRDAQRVHLLGSLSQLGAAIDEPVSQTIYGQDVFPPAAFPAAAESRQPPPSPVGNRML